MTTPNGHHQVDVFEGVELPPDAETQALLELMALADDVEAGRLTEEGHRRAREALAVLRRDVDREPSSFRQAVALAQTNLRGSLETLTRAIETANPLRVATWGHTMPQPRQWLIDESLPAGRVALLTGEGGAGKSRLALQLAAGVASGGDNREWIANPHGIMRLGNAVPPDGANVVFASWEDEPEEFYRRLHQISGKAAPWVTPERLQGLRIVNLVGEGPIWAPEQGRHISSMAELTATGERLRRLCEQEDARLLVVDPLAAAYAADENARGLVRAFVSHWDAWGQANNCTVLMLAHPPKSAGVNYAGSTDWQGAARALWTLRSESGKSPDAGPAIWKLEFVKGNYGPRPEPLQLRWDTGSAGLRWEVVGETAGGTTEGGMKLTTEGTFNEIAAAFLEGLTEADVILPEVARSFPNASEQADVVLAQGRGERPTEKELSQWINGGDCPTDAINATCGRMTALLGSDVLSPLKIIGGVVFTKDTVIAIEDLWGVYRKAVDAGEKVRWPMAPLVNAWQNPPRPVEPSKRTTARVIPARLAMAATVGPSNGRLLFSPAAHTGYGSDGKQLVMPGFAKPNIPSPALPLALYDLGAGPAISPGKGAPLALRMFVESVLSVPMDERERGLPVAMSVSLRDFLKWLYPTRTPSPAEYWPRLMAAVEALDSLDARVPLYDPQTKRNELRRVVSVGGIPRGPGALDESVRIIVDLPPGSGNGPQVSDNLRLWGVKSAPAYRLLINLAYQWHNPGVTKIPVGKGKGRHWIQVDDPDRYPVINDTELVALTFPTTNRHRGRRSSEALALAKQLEKAGELRFVEGKILPPLVVTDHR